MPLENLNAVILTLDESLFTAFRYRFAESGVELMLATDSNGLKKLLVNENIVAVILDSSCADKIFNLNIEQVISMLSASISPRIIIVIAEDNVSSEQIIKLLKLGAHDVVPSSVRPRILAEQIKAFVRVSFRKKKQEKHWTSLSLQGLLVMDYPKRKCYVKNMTDSADSYITVKLTKMEFQILYLLLRKKGAVVTYDDFRRHFWPDAWAHGEVIHTLHQLVTNIRKKINPCPVKIENLRGEGFRLEKEE